MVTVVQALSRGGATLSFNDAGGSHHVQIAP
jgi:hypothetical protein